MGNADCGGCAGRNAVLVVTSTIKKNYRAIDIILHDGINAYSYMKRINMQFAVNNAIGPFFLHSDNADDDYKDEREKVIKKLNSLTEYDKYIVSSEVSALEYEEYYANGKIDEILMLSIGEVKECLVMNNAGVYRLPLYFAILKDSPFVKYDKKHNDYIDHDTKTRHQIEVDLPRTFPKLPIVTKEAFVFNYRSLLCEIAGRDKKISYVQGMGFIGAFCLLLTGNQSEAALILFTKVLSLKSKLFKLPYKNCFDTNFPLLMKYLSHLRQLLSKYHKDIYDKILEYDINDHLWASKWILTLFLSQWDLGLSIKFWDIIISQGIDSILIISLTIIEHFKESLVKTLDINQFTQIIGHDILLTKPESDRLLRLLTNNITNSTYEL